MKVGLWAEIRRLAEIEKLSARVISRRLHCSWRHGCSSARMGAAPRTLAPEPRQPLGPVQGQDRCTAGQVSRTIGGAHPRRNCSRPRWLHWQRDYRPPLCAVNPARAVESIRRSTTSPPRPCRSTGASAAASR